MHSAKKGTMTTTCLSIVVIYYFIVAQLCKEDDDMGTFPHCRFYEFGNGFIKIMCFKHKKIELKYYNSVELCFFHINCGFSWNIFCHKLPMFGHTHIFFSFIVICIHLRCYITNGFHFIMYALGEKKQLKYLVNQKKKDMMFFSMFFLCFFFFDMCFDNLIKIYASHQNI